jgi:hypothetical protein
MRQEEAYLCVNSDADVISRLPKREKRKSSVWECDCRAFNDSGTKDNHPPAMTTTIL